MDTVLQTVERDTLGDIAPVAEQFLRQLAGPSCLFIPGRDRSRTRALVTLIHGNEPSGFRALHRWLRSGREPAVNIVAIVPSVQTALMAPHFSLRMLPGQRDLNRCFEPPHGDDEQGQTAAAIIDCLKKYQPECVVDLHNTSGSGPGFGVVISEDDAHAALVSLFSPHMIVTALRLGALMEISEHLFPTVTVECGGRRDDTAHELAWQGLQRYFNDEQVLLTAYPRPYIFHNPVRLELQSGCSVAVNETPQPDFDVTLAPNVEQYNYDRVTPSQPLATVRAPLKTVFRARDHNGNDVLEELVEVREGVLYPRCELKLFMFTNDPTIARSDCLFYAVKAF